MRGVDWKWAQALWLSYSLVVAIVVYLASLLFRSGYGWKARLSTADLPILQITKAAAISASHRFFPTNIESSRGQVGHSKSSLMFPVHTLVLRKLLLPYTGSVRRAALLGDSVWFKPMKYCIS